MKLYFYRWNSSKKELETSMQEVVGETPKAYVFMDNDGYPCSYKKSNIGRFCASRFADVVLTENDKNKALQKIAGGLREINRQREDLIKRVKNEIKNNQKTIGIIETLWVRSWQKKKNSV